MKISFIEIQNFRKLRATYIGFHPETTLFVGANNSGKTSAMLVLRYFLLATKKLSLRDITVANWPKIDDIGLAWESNAEPADSLADLLPCLDIWLDVPLTEIHLVTHILPSMEWSGGLIGVRLRYELKTVEKLKAEYLKERAANAEIAKTTPGAAGLWPVSLTDYLIKRLPKYLERPAYVLDPAKRADPVNGVARPQDLPSSAFPLEREPFEELIKIDEIAAQRDFADAGDRATGSAGDDRFESGGKRFKRKLSEQLRSYYDRHLDPSKVPSVEDFGALLAIQQAEQIFDSKLVTGFADALKELGDLGYPGVSNPKLRIKTQLNATDGLRHRSAVQYEVADPAGDGSTSLQLPEDYAGLGYQNLISMVFMLMGFRDEWMQVGKAAAPAELEDHVPEPLHLVLVEEPEAHLHAQVQQVFIKKAYKLLRNRKELEGNATFSTQLVVSTHSSHVAHEADFSSLRYFRRRRAASNSETPTTTVSNLSHVFGDGDDTQRFVRRYLKATHCDLFFADGVIFAEGQAERILVPHFVRHHFESLSRRYITLIEVGGSHAHRFKSLVEALGLTTLVIADIDAVEERKPQKSEGEEPVRWVAARPDVGRGQRTSNTVLKDWHPKQETIDDLVRLAPEAHITPIDNESNLYVAYQKQTVIQQADGTTATVIPRTFEDALIFANQNNLGALSGSATTERIKTIAASAISGNELAQAIFELLKKVEKAEFALDCLMFKDPKAIVPPPYIRDGLSWLQRTLDETVIDAPPGALNK